MSTLQDSTVRFTIRHPVGLFQSAAIRVISPRGASSGSYNRRFPFHLVKYNIRRKPLSVPPFELRYILSTVGSHVGH